MSRVIVVVPCYNEARRLDADRYRRFASRCDAVRFLMVNDGSTDATLELLGRLQAASPHQFVVCHLPHNVGKAEAVRRGFLEAFRWRPDYVAFWDADLATPLEAIEEFRDLLDRRAELLMVIGTRIPLLGRRVERRPFRKFLGGAFAAVVSWMLGFRVYDTQCGAKMFRASPETQAVFERPFFSRWIFDVEILARLIRRREATRQESLRQVIYELPLSEWREVGGSRLKARDFVKAVIELAVIYGKYLFGRPSQPEDLTPDGEADVDVVPLPCEPRQAPSSQSSQEPGRAA